MTVIRQIHNDRFKQVNAPSSKALATTERLFDGKYEILETIEGPNSNILKVRDTSGNELAIKVVDARKHNEDGQIIKKLKMLENEISVGRSLKHPNIVQYSDGPFYAEPYEIQAPTGEKITQYSQRYIIMEYFGQSLSSLVEGKKGLRVRLSEEQIKEIAKKVLDALTLCHSRNIIHRDINPNNILVKFENGQISGVKLADFGAANTPILDTEQSGTMSTASVCTNGFTAKEAFVSPQKVSDIYSLGATILYCATHGKHDADKRDRDPTGWDEVVASTGSLAGVVAKSLSLDQRDRYQTATDMREALSNGSALVVHKSKPSFFFRAAVVYRKWKDPSSLTREQLEYLIEQGLDHSDKKTPEIVQAAIEKVPMQTLLGFAYLPIPDQPTRTIRRISKLEQEVEKAADAEEIEAFYYENVERLSSEAKRVLGNALVPKLKDSKKIKELFFSGLLSVRHLVAEITDPVPLQRVAGANRSASILWEKLSEKDALEIFESDQFAEGRKFTSTVFLLGEIITTSENALRVIRLGIKFTDTRKKLIGLMTMADIRNLVDEAEELSEETQEILLTRVSKGRKDRTSLAQVNPGRIAAFSSNADLAYLLSSGKFTDSESFLKGTYSGGITANDIFEILSKSSNLPDRIQNDLVKSYLQEVENDEQKAFDLLKTCKITSSYSIAQLCSEIKSEEKAFELLYSGNFTKDTEGKLAFYINNSTLAERLVDKAQSDHNLAHYIERTQNFDQAVAVYARSPADSVTRLASINRICTLMPERQIAIFDPLEQIAFLRKIIFVDDGMLGAAEQRSIATLIIDFTIQNSQKYELIEDAIFSGIVNNPLLLSIFSENYRTSFDTSNLSLAQSSIIESFMRIKNEERSAIGKRILMSDKYDKKLEGSLVKLITDQKTAVEILASKEFVLANAIQLASRITDPQARAKLISKKPSLGALFST